MRSMGTDSHSALAAVTMVLEWCLSVDLDASTNYLLS
jgi:hypothetical protein